MQGTCFNITFEECFKQFPDEYQKELPHAKQLGETSIMFLLDHTITYTGVSIQKRLMLF